MNLPSKLIYLLLLLPIAANAEKQQELVMVALEFEGAIQQNKKGAFDYMLQDLAKRSQIEHSYQVMSTARGARYFFLKDANCIIPSTTYPGYFKGYNVIHSESFAKAIYVAFTPAGSSVVNDKKDMKDKLIGVLRDSDTWNYEKRLAIEDAKYIKVSNLESLVNMLYKKRIDVAIHDNEDFTYLAERLGYPTPQANHEYPIAIDEVVITCHTSKLNQAYLNIINPHIKAIVKDGMSKYHLKTNNYQ